VVCAAASKLQCKCESFYCSAACQKADWPQHKSVCATLCKLRQDFLALCKLNESADTNAEASWNLGECLFAGVGCEIDQERAVGLFKKTIEKNGLNDSPDHTFRLGEVLEEMGREEEAKAWFVLAANQNHSRAQQALAEVLLEEGDVAEAKKWLEAASKQGEVGVCTKRL